MRSLVVHFSGGTEISIETAADLIVEDALGERHYLAVKQIAYLTFVSNKGIGFA
jgi:hypothetical protein